MGVPRSAVLDGGDRLAQRQTQVGTEALCQEAEIRRNARDRQRRGSHEVLISWDRKPASACRRLHRGVLAATAPGRSRQRGRRSFRTADTPHRIQGGIPCLTVTKGGSLVQPFIMVSPHASKGGSLAQRQPRGVPLFNLNQGGFPCSTSTKGGSLSLRQPRGVPL